jgi:acetylornithine deacetylase/succinyl-diaminopimelate desuccinylase-like protein
MIPGKARAFLDFYLVPDQDPWDIFSKLQRHLQEYDFQDIQVRMLNGSRPARTPTNAPFVEAVRRATAAAYGIVPFILPMGSESNSIETFRRILDLPVVSTTTGFSELDEDTRKRVFAASIKQLATIFEEMNGYAISHT